MQDARVLDVAVPGGTLRAGVWGEAGEVALAIHGITGSHVAWALVAGHLAGGLRLAAPDLRGRGRSRDLPGPYGMARHADDSVALLDQLGVQRAVVAGHSMGGWVALVLAHRHPDRISRLVLVDGGLPSPPPPGLSADEVVAAVLGPAAQRLTMTFESRDAYRGFWRQHPALSRWNAAIEAYVDYDLVGEPPDLRPRAVYDAVREDSVDLHTGKQAAVAFAELAHPTTFLRAERGLLNQERALYTEDEMRRYAGESPLIEARTVAGTNHYTILLDEPGAGAVAEAIVG